MKVDSMNKRWDTAPVLWFGQSRDRQGRRPFHVLIVFKTFTQHLEADAGDWNVVSTANDRGLAGIEQRAVAIAAEIAVVNGAPCGVQMQQRFIIEHAAHTVHPAQHPLCAGLGRAVIHHYAGPAREVIPADAAATMAHTALVPE